MLFICTGDTCRSPMAAGYFSKLLDENDLIDLEVRSAGVMTVTGLRASQEAQQVMESEVVDLDSHRSSQLSAEMIRRADLILGMSPLHVQTALRMQEGARGKTHLFKEYTKSDLKNIQIADPMGCTLEVFKKCFDEVKAACDLLLKSEFVIMYAKKRPVEPAESTALSEEELAEEPAEEPAEESPTQAEQPSEPAPAEKPPSKKAPAVGVGKKKAAAKKKAAGPEKRAQKKAAKKKRAAAKSAPKSKKKTTKKKSAAKKKSPTKKKSPVKKKAPAAKKKKKSGRKTSSRR